MSTSATKYSDTQKKILTATLTLTAKNGFKATTTKQIAQEANINESTLFKNFASKTKVFAAIQEHETFIIQQKIQKMLKQNFTDMQAFIRSTTEQVYAIFLAHSSYITIILRELDNEILNIGKNSIFEYLVNTFALFLSEHYKQENVDYNTAMFMHISSLMIMVVNQTNHHALTDDLHAPIHIEQISKFTHQMLQSI